MDMMQNAAIIHHPDSLNEVSIMGLMLFGKYFSKAPWNFIFTSYFVHHMFQYTLTLYR